MRIGGVGEPAARGSVRHRFLHTLDRARLVDDFHVAPSSFLRIAEHLCVYGCRRREIQQIIRTISLVRHTQGGKQKKRECMRCFFVAGHTHHVHTQTAVFYVYAYQMQYFEVQSRQELHEMRPIHVWHSRKGTTGQQRTKRGFGIGEQGGSIIYSWNGRSPFGNIESVVEERQ